jgi:hypothetical protein
VEQSKETRAELIVTFPFSPEEAEEAEVAEEVAEVAAALCS